MTLFQPDGYNAGVNRPYGADSAAAAAGKTFSMYSPPLLHINYLCSLFTYVLAGNNNYSNAPGPQRNNQGQQGYHPYRRV